MKIVRDEMATELASLLRSTAHARERLARAQATFLLPAEPGVVSQAKSYPPFQVMEAAMRDGYDFRVAQQVFGLFSPARKIRASVWALDRMEAEGVYEQACTIVEQASLGIERSLCPDTLSLAIIPADPSNRNLMIRNSGLSVFGDAGRIAAVVWPSPGNLARLGPALVRSFALATRWKATEAARGYTLADALVAEGLAAAILAAMFPGVAMPWVLAHVAPATWEEELDAIAELYGLRDYAKVPANTYGRSDWRDVQPPPGYVPLDVEELEYAEAVITESLDSTDPRIIAAHLYGDAIIGEQGHRQVGLSPYAGFEVAYWLMERTGLDPHVALGLPTRAVLAAITGRLNRV